jgi:hypothetical protein
MGLVIHLIIPFPLRLASALSSPLARRNTLPPPPPAVIGALISRIPESLLPATFEAGDFVLLPPGIPLVTCKYGLFIHIGVCVMHTIRTVILLPPATRPTHAHMTHARILLRTQPCCHVFNCYLLPLTLCVNHARIAGFRNGSTGSLPPLTPATVITAPWSHAPSSKHPAPLPPTFDTPLAATARQALEAASRPPVFLPVFALPSADNDAGLALATVRRSDRHLSCAGTPVVRTPAPQLDRGTFPTPTDTTPPGEGKKTIATTAQADFDTAHINVLSTEASFTDALQQYATTKHMLLRAPRAIASAVKPTVLEQDFSLRETVTTLIEQHGSLKVGLFSLYVS